MKTDTNTLIDALRILARDIDSKDGIANAAIAEAADRIERLHTAVARLHDLLHKANATFTPSNDGACQEIAEALKETEWLTKQSEKP